jgi:hypothetical protein
MTIEKAFEDLIKNWEKQTQQFRDKYRHTKSRYPEISKSAMHNALIEAGYKENWTK